MKLVLKIEFLTAIKMWDFLEKILSDTNNFLKNMLNKIITGLFILFLYLFVGNAINHFLLPMVPGSIIGMILLFFSLQLGIIKEQSVELVANYLILTMPIFFLPPAVGIIDVFPTIGENLLSILLTVIISTVGVLLSVGWCQQLLNRKKDANGKLNK